ncbi:hypothetical protein LXA43DRAFT_1036691, partial [Ganoderma leucocontextum]
MTPFSTNSPHHPLLISTPQSGVVHQCIALKTRRSSPQTRMEDMNRREHGADCGSSPAGCRRTVRTYLTSAQYILVIQRYRRVRGFNVQRRMPSRSHRVRVPMPEIEVVDAPGTCHRDRRAWLASGRDFRLYNLTRAARAIRVICSLGVLFRVIQRATTTPPGTAGRQVSTKLAPPHNCPRASVTEHFRIFHWHHLLSQGLDGRTFRERRASGDPTRPTCTALTSTTLLRGEDNGLERMLFRII